MECLMAVFFFHDLPANICLCVLLQVRRRRGPGPQRAVGPAARGCATSRRSHRRSVGHFLPTSVGQTLLLLLLLFTLQACLLVYRLFISPEKQPSLSSSANRAVSVITAKPLKEHG